MQALRRRLAGLSGAGLDPELVQFHVPSLGPVRRRRQCVKHLPADIEKTQGNRMGGDGLGHRSEPTFDSPIERVVVPALIVRLVRFANNAIGRNGEGREATAAVAAAVGHVCVDAEVVPARGEGWPFGKRRGRQERAKLLRGHKTEPRRSNLLDDDRNISGHRACRPPEQHETRDSIRHAIIPLAILRYHGASTSSHRLNRLGSTVASLYRRKAMLFSWIAAVAQHFTAEMRPMALLLNVVAASYATWRLNQNAAIDRKTLLLVTLPSLVAAFVGGLLVLGGKVYFALTGLLLVTAAVLMIVRREVDSIEAQSVKAFPAALAGAASGLLSGLTGVGGGVFLTTLIIALGWASPKRAAALSPPFILCNSAVGLVGVLIAGQKLTSDASLYL